MPLCLEKKLTLSGAVQTFSCELVRYEPGFGILKYIIDREYDIAGIKLLPGDVTCALYWEDRPYTLYIWHRLRDERPVYYFNIADSVSLRPEEFAWRDLAVDILIDAQEDPRVLDEDELPRELGTGLFRYIQNARDHILTRFRDIMKEADRLLRANPNC